MLVMTYAAAADFMRTASAPAPRIQSNGPDNSSQVAGDWLRHRLAAAGCRTLDAPCP